LELGTGESERKRDGVFEHFSGTASVKPQCWWPCEKAARGREGPATAFSAGTFCVGASAGRLQFWSWALASVSEREG